MTPGPDVASCGLRGYPHQLKGGHHEVLTDKFSMVRRPRKKRLGRFFFPRNLLTSPGVLVYTFPRQSANTKNTMSNPLSTYDLIYKGLSEEDRVKLERDIAALLAKSVEEANKQLILGVQKAATEAYNNLLVNPWPQLLAENAGAYGAIQAIADDIWETMLKAKPGSDPGDFRLQEFLKAWSQNYPEHFAAAVGEAAAKRIEELEEKNARLVRILSAPR